MDSSHASGIPVPRLPPLRIIHERYHLSGRQDRVGQNDEPVSIQDACVHPSLRACRLRVPCFPSGKNNFDATEDGERRKQDFG
eukprot:1694278-Rhodomonas_salina.1